MNIQKHDQHTFDKDNSQFNLKWDVAGLSILHFISLIGLFQRYYHALSNKCNKP